MAAVVVEAVVVVAAAVEVIENHSDESHCTRMDRVAGRQKLDHMPDVRGEPRVRNVPEPLSCKKQHLKASTRLEIPDLSEVAVFLIF